MSDIIAKAAESFLLRQEKTFSLPNNEAAEYIPRMTLEQIDIDGFKLRLRMRMAKRGLSAQATSVRAGLSRDTIGKLLKSEGQLPTSKTLRAIVEVLATSEPWLLRNEGPEDSGEASLDPQLSDLAPQRPNRYAHVLGAAAGSHTDGAFQFSTNFHETVIIPPGIAHLPNVYAINIEGDSMWPEHKHNELRFVLPSIQPQLGDTVVVEFRRDPDREPEAMIGHLLKRTPMVRLGKLNPENTVEIHPRSVIRLHRLATYDELVGRGFA